MITKPFKINNKYKIKRKTNSAVIKAVKFIFSLRLNF